MKKILSIVCIVFMLSVIACQTEKNNDGWIQMFNGVDLTGWKANVSPESYWVKDGIMVVNDTSETIRSHLFYVDKETQELVNFKNFELEIISKCEPNSNSGIFFHTDYSERDAAKHLGKGYEIQLNNSDRDPRKTGSLYAIKDISESPVDETQWFKLYIKVNGKRIIAKVNDELVMDYTEPENPERPENRKNRLLDPNGGAIAIQAHDANSTWYFKEIKVRRLPD